MRAERHGFALAVVAVVFCGCVGGWPAGNQEAFLTAQNATSARVAGNITYAVEGGASTTLAFDLAPNQSERLVDLPVVAALRVDVLLDDGRAARDVVDTRAAQAVVTALITDEGVHVAVALAKA